MVHQPVLLIIAGIIKESMTNFEQALEMYDTASK